MPAEWNCWRGERSCWLAAAAGGLLDPAGQVDRWEAAMRRAAGR